MFCKNCGHEIMENETVCSACGTKVDMAGEPKAGQNYEQAKKVEVVDSVTGQTISSGQQKSRLAAGLLGIFLGMYGAHNFYLGYTTKAIIQLVCTLLGWVLTCVFVGYFLLAGIGIWSLVESIMIFTGSLNVDAKGVQLCD